MQKNQYKEWSRVGRGDSFKILSSQEDTHSIPHGLNTFTITIHTNNPSIIISTII